MDPQHRAFLGYCDGWPDFRLETRLLSTEELGRGQVWEDLNSGSDAFYEALPGPGIVPPRHRICPISYDEGASDVFAIRLNGPASDGGRPVLWPPWQEGAEPYADFFEFFRASYRTYQELFDRADVE